VIIVKGVPSEEASEAVGSMLTKLTVLSSSISSLGDAMSAVRDVVGEPVGPVVGSACVGEAGGTDGPDGFGTGGVSFDGVRHGSRRGRRRLGWSLQ
jgi:hypothetical protein